METSVMRPEFLHVADAVAREKNIDRNEVLSAMEEAIAKAGRQKYGAEKDIRAVIDRKSGEVTLSRWIQVVDPRSFDDKSDKKNKMSAKHISLSEAKKIRADVKLGEFFTEPLPPIDFGRVASQMAKQVITKRIKEIERLKQVDIFKDRIGEIISGTVKRLEYGNVIIDLGGNTEALLPRKGLIRRESFAVGDRVRSYVEDVRSEDKGPQIFLSRTHNNFLAKLFSQEVPEVYDGIIEFRAIARDPGSHSKVAVYSRDHSINPVMLCIGRQGSCVNAVKAELQGERIDIIPWSDNLTTFVASCMTPANVEKIVLHESTNGSNRIRMDIVVAEDMLSKAIGPRGQNVLLASRLTGCSLNVLTEAQENKARQEEHKRVMDMFMEELDIDDMFASFLIAENFSEIEELVAEGIEGLSLIEGMEDIAVDLFERAEEALERRQAKRYQDLLDRGVSEYLMSLTIVSIEDVEKLLEKNIKTRDDLADLDMFELCDILSSKTEDEANQIITEARAHWFN